MQEPTSLLTTYNVKSKLGNKWKEYTFIKTLITAWYRPINLNRKTRYFLSISSLTLLKFSYLVRISVSIIKNKNGYVPSSCQFAIRHLECVAAHYASYLEKFMSVEKNLINSIISSFRLWTSRWCHSFVRVLLGIFWLYVVFYDFDFHCHFAHGKHISE